MHPIPMEAAPRGRRRMAFVALLVFAATPAFGQAAREDVPPDDPQAYLASAIGDRDPLDCLRHARLELAQFVRRDEGGEEEPMAARRVVVAVDASGSMRRRLGGETKIEAAKRATAAYLAGLPAETETGLVVFGHEGAPNAQGRSRSCAGVETVMPLGRNAAGEIGEAVNRLRANGWTPLASAIERASALFAEDGRPGEQVIWVVSDGVETCGGDPVAAARAAFGGRRQVQVNIIGFDVEPRERAELAAIAAAGGGRFLEARGAGDLDALFRNSRARMDRTMNELRANMARTMNANRVNLAVNMSTTCVNMTLNSQAANFGMKTSGDAVFNRVDPAVVTAARDLLERRQALVREALQRHVAALRSAEGEAAERIEADLARALAGR